MRSRKWRLSPVFLAVALFGTEAVCLAQQRETRGSPVYPLAAKAKGIDGPVVLRFTITKDGKTRDVHAISGPAELRQPAVDAVLMWTFHPYRHFGHPVEVETTLTVNFDMGTGEKKKAEQARAQAELELATHSQPTKTGPSDE